jgi:Domain of unknown function (DUF5659)
MSIKPDQLDDEYRTTDMSLAAALTAFGFDLVYVDRQDARRASFVFEDSGDLRKLVSNFYGHQCQLSALLYWQAIKNLKAQLYAD